MKTCTACNVVKEPSAFGKTNNQCKPCRAEKQRVYRAKNIEAQREATRKWRAENEDHRKAYAKTYNIENKEARNKACQEWRDNNPEKSSESQRKYRQNNKGKLAAKNTKRYTAKMQRTVGWADLEAIGELYDQASHLTATTGIKHHVDHIIPLQGKLVSGLHVETNLQILTASENCSKGNTYRIQSA